MTTNQQFQPVFADNEGKCNTLNGMFNFLNPSEDAIRIDDIANALSKICRFNGQVSHFYTVAQHSCLVAMMSPAWCRKEALMHDAAEAYIGDIIKPVKNLLGASFHSIESNLETVIAQKYGLKTDQVTKDEIKKWDRFAVQLEHEAFQLLKPTRLMNLLYSYGWLIMQDEFTWDHQLARKLFKVTFIDIFENENSAAATATGMAG